MDNNKRITLTSQHFLKQKMENLLYSEQFCGLCYETGRCYNLFNEELKIITNDWTQDIRLRDVYSYVFHGIEYLPISDYICSQCTEQLKQSYIFIQNSKFITRLLATSLDDLDSKSNDLISHLKENTQYESTKIVIVLENNDIEKYLRKDFKNKPNKKEENVTIRMSRNSDEKICFKCLECSEELPTLLLWKEHTKTYHKQEFKCKICSKTFKNQAYLTAHYKIHSKVRCKICHLILSNEEIKDHLRNLHEDNVFPCNICTDAFYTLNGLKTHERIMHAVKNEEFPQCENCLLNLNNGKQNCKFKCSDCIETPCIHNEYLISYKEQILNHVSKVKCLDCDYVCRKKEILIGHVNREHLDHYPFTCDKCGQQFHSKLVLRMHIQGSHREMNSCKYCNVECNALEVLRSHEANCKLIRKEHKCGSCPMSFPLPEELEKHEKQRHKDIFPCDSCSKVFLEESKRKEHAIKVHSGVQIKNMMSKLECVICEKIFDTKGELIRHRKSHGPNAKFPCRICNTEYESLRKLRAHGRKHIGPFATCGTCGKEMRRVLLAKHLENHKLDGIVSCSTCGKSFQNIILLKYHQKSHLANVPCLKCDKMINPAKLRRHMKGHFAEENPLLKENYKQKARVKCNECDYITWNSILLECHNNRHHLKVKPYICHVCSKDFTGKHLLRKHIESHTLDKSIVCMVCGKKFANSTCLKLHLRLHTGEKNYPCDICGERFRSSSIMNVHKRKKHSEKENACPLCTSKFYTLVDLRRHIVKVHWKDRSRQFNPRDLQGLENHYHLFHDNRRIKIDDKDIDFYMPC